MENIEIWKDIPEHDGHYQVSNFGNVKSLKRKKENILKPFECRGYLKVGIMLKNKRRYYFVHQLVAIAFLDHVICGHELVINHKNFIRSDNKLSNLEIITHRENCNKKHLKSTSKYVGVFWVTQKNKWASKIDINGKTVFLGFFTDEKEASEYYEQALVSHNNGKEIKKKKHLYTSQHKGVSFDKINNKWRSRVCVDKKYINLGRFKTEEEALQSIINYTNKSNNSFNSVIV